MRLVRLRLSNFRQHRASEILFAKGITGILGSNGAGKSSIVEALSYALFGSRALRGKVEDVRTRAAKRTERCEVELSYEHDGVPYRIWRSLTEADLFQGGEAQPLVSGTREVTQRVEALLGMSYEEFAATYLTEQKGLEFLSGRKGAAERERFIVRMMGYDRLERAQELLRTDRKEERLAIQGYESGLGSREIIEQRVAAELSAVERAIVLRDEALRTLVAADKHIEKLRPGVRQQEESYATYRALREFVVGSTVRVQEQRARLVQYESALQRLAASETVVPFNEQELLQTRSALATRSQSIEDEFIALEAQTHELEGQHREQVARFQALIEGATQERERAGQALEKIAALNAQGSCPTCGQTLGENFMAVGDLGRGRLRQAEEQLERHSGDLAARRGALDLQLKALHERLSELRTLRISLKDQLSQSELRERAAAEQRRLDQECKQMQAELAISQLAWDQAQQQVAQLNFSEGEYHSKRQSLETAERLAEVCRLQNVRLEGELQREEALLKRARTELASYDARLRELQDRRARLSQLEDGDRLLTDFRKYLNTSIRPRLSELAGEYLTELSDGRYAAVEIGEDFAPTVLEDDLPKATISGGEEDILNLCVRLALSQMLAERAGHQFSLLVLDEIFGSLDEQRRMNVLALLERLSARFEQILVISHFEEIKEGVHQAIFVNYDESTTDLQIGEQPMAVDLIAVNI